MAQAITHGFRLYAGVWENKPPAIYLLYATVYHRFGPSLPAVRVLAALAALITVAGVASVSRLWIGRRAPVAALLCGLLLGVPFLEGTTANAEIFLIAFTTWAVALGMRGRRLAAGLLMGAAVLFKVVALFDAAALGLFLLTRPDLSLRRAVPYAAGATLPIAAAVVWAAHLGILRAMLRDAVLYDLGYVAHANGGTVPWLLLVKVGALAALTAVLLARPFPALWLVWSAAGALWGGRLFGHYALQAIPALSILAVMALPLDREPRRFVRRWTLSLIALFLAAALAGTIAGRLLLATGHDSILARRLQWYANVVRLAVGSRSYAWYSAQIDDHVERNIALAARVRRLPPGRLLVWGNVPWVYVLSGRLPATPYTSAYRDPPVPGETAALRRAIIRQQAPVVVVISPPLPPMDSTDGRALHRCYRLIGRVGDGSLYVARARQG